MTALLQAQGEPESRGTPGDAVPQDRTVQVNGLRLHYLDWGNLEAPSMLLLHGTASHAHIWDRFAAAVRHAFHIVALDQRGFGDSEWPPDYKTGYLQEYWASDIKGVIDALRLSPVVLIGLSTGGNNAMHFTAAHPADVARLVIVEMGPEVVREGADRVIQSIPSQEEFDNVEEAVKYLAGSAGRADPILAREHTIHALKPLGDRRVALKGDPSLRRRDWRRPLRTVEENWAAVHSITCPTLLIRGGESRLLSAEIAERMAREMKDCTLVTIPGAGHSVPLHRPVEFEAAVREWLGVEAAPEAVSRLAKQVWSLGEVASRLHTGSRVQNLSEPERLTADTVLDLIEQADWRGADLAGEDLSDLDFSAPVLEAQRQKRGFAPEKMPPWWSPTEEDRGKPAGLNLYRAQLETTVFRRTVMPGADLRAAVLAGAAGGGANLNGALLEGTHLRGASFKGAHFEGADLSRCEAELAFFGECKMAGANLSGGNFESAEFFNADLRGADLRGARFHGTLFQGADLRGALTEGADFTGANLDRTLRS